MLDIIEQSGLGRILLAGLFLAFGIVLFSYSDSAVSVIIYAMGGLSIGLGVLRLTKYSTGKSIGIGAIIVGFIIICFSETVISFFRILIAIFIFGLGITRYLSAKNLKEQKNPNWKLLNLMSILILIISVLTLFSAGMPTTIIGLTMIVTALLDLVQEMIYKKKVNAPKDNENE